MLLRRVGNKNKIAELILPYFPPHDIYIEMFFGAGGMFFNKKPVSHNFMNDIENDIFNVFQVITTQYEELQRLINLMPTSQELFNYWKTHLETDPVRKAARFLMLSNYGYMGKTETFRISTNNSKRSLEENLIKTYEYMISSDVNKTFMNCDFRDVLSKISFQSKNKDNPDRDDKQRAFIYADPPYLNTGSNYSATWNKNDTISLIDVLINSKIRFAISEYNNSEILKIAAENNLNVYYICERRTQKSRNVEILLTNYKQEVSLFD